MVPRSQFVTVMILACVGLPGCIPGVAWFPDGKKIAFMEYRDGDSTGSLTRYSIDGKTCTTLVKDTGTRTLWPAVSPDGTRIAVARWYHDKAGRPSQLQVILYDVDGKVRHRSRLFDWTQSPTGKSGVVEETYLCWNHPDHILVLAGKLGIYDRVNNRLTEVADCTPWLCGSSSVRPDRTGFLATRQRKDGEEDLVFVNWQGKISPFAGKIPDQESFGSVPYLRWEKNNAWLHGAKESLHIDLAKQKIAPMKTKGSLPLPAPGRLVSWYRFADTGLSLCSFSQDDPNSAEQRPVERLELHDSIKKNRRILLSPFTNIGLFIPSPDGTRLAMRCRTLNETETILIVDSRGKMLAELRLRRE